MNKKAVQNIEEILKDNQKEQIYEFAYLLHSALDSEQVKKTTEGIKKEIEKISTKVISESEPEIINLAYTIKVNEGGHYSKHDKAFFGWIKFVADTQSLEALKEEIKFNQKIIRYMIVKTVEEDTRAQIEQEAFEKLNEAQTMQNSEIDVSNQDQEELSDEEIDKVVEELLSKIDDDIEEETTKSDRQDTKEA